MIEEIAGIVCAIGIVIIFAFSLEAGFILSDWYMGLII
jgi:hypothetical protein